MVQPCSNDNTAIRDGGLLQTGHFRPVLYLSLRENTLGDSVCWKKSKNKNLSAVGFSGVVAFSAYLCRWMFFFSQPIENRMMNTMVEKSHETGIRKGLIGGNFWFCPRRCRRVLSAVSGSFTVLFTPIWPWGCLKSNFERIREFLHFWRSEVVQHGNGRQSAPFSGGEMTVRVWIWCDVSYLYPSPLNLDRSIAFKEEINVNRSSRFDVDNTIALKERTNLDRSSRLIPTVRSSLKREQIRTVYTCGNASGSSDREHTECQCGLPCGTELGCLATWCAPVRQNCWLYGPTWCIFL